jgi:hypothetical protein
MYFFVILSLSVSSSVLCYGVDILTTTVYSMLMNKVLYGRTDMLWGDTSGLYGKISMWLHGDVTGLYGNCTHVLGNCTGVFGDLDSIPREGVPGWIHLNDYTING